MNISKNIRLFGQLHAAAIACGLLCALPASAEAQPRMTGAFRQSGTASFYRAPYKNGGMTMAHRSLPFDTPVLVTNLRNRKSACVLVEDRGPFGKGRVADLSETAANRIGLTKKQGITQVLLAVNACH